MNPLVAFLVVASILCVAAVILVARKSVPWALVVGLVAVTLLTSVGYVLSPVLKSGPTQTTGNGSDLSIDVSLAKSDSVRPVEIKSDGYVSASACTECHKEKHGSWHDSYHRTMTQLATPETVIGDFDNKVVTFEGQYYHLRREGDTFIAKMSGEKLTGSESEEMEVPLVMTTGSHHMQVYWFPTGEGRKLAQLPIVYLKEEQKWVPRRACFLMPPGLPPNVEEGRWNDTCLNCHTTHPKERKLDNSTWDTSVVQFGISCEACHGPAESHIEYHRNRKSGSSVEDQEDPIVNPENLDHQLSAQICGSCHSIAAYPSAKMSLTGSDYRPGQPLTPATHRIMRRDQETLDYLIEIEDPDPAEFLDSLFWLDGMARVSGREFSGLNESACYLQGTMACTSCHSLHQQEDDSRDRKTWANDQLAVAMETDRACTQCHDKSSYGEKHTHHSIQSEGSRCYNCHMPHTTYGLLKAIRSHTITSPSAVKDHAAERPNACNLCHLDQTMSWAADSISEWYGTDEPQNFDKDEQNIAAGILWSLKGDAGTRALAAWHLGWEPAREISGEDWLVPYLWGLMDDPYDAVRYVAGKSLNQLRGFENINFDYVGPRDKRSLARQEVFRIWQTQNPQDRAKSSALLIDDNGQLDANEFGRISRQRDNKIMFLGE